MYQPTAACHKCQIIRRFIGAMLLLACWLPARAAEVDFGRYHALVIGNNDYQHLPRLKTAVSDAVAVAELLKSKYGFKVTLRLNATRDRILSDINALRATLTEKDRLLIYYAGHGELDRETGTGYWLPVDAKPEDDTRWIANQSLTRHFRAMTVQHILVVADSCYSGTLVRAASAAPKTGSERNAWLERMAGRRARQAFVSGSLEPVLDGGGGGHSVFARAFLDSLRDADGILDGQTLAQQVSRKVVLNADQTPQYSNIRKSGHDGGDFLFVPIGTSMTAVPPGQGNQGGNQANGQEMELALWNGVKESTDPAAFKAYLKQFPQGTFADLAKLKLAALMPATAALPKAQPTGRKRRQPAAESQSVDRFDGLWQWTLITEGSECDISFGPPVEVRGGRFQGTVTSGADPGLRIVYGKIDAAGRVTATIDGDYVSVAISGQVAGDDGSGKAEVSGQATCTEHWTVTRVGS